MNRFLIVLCLSWACLLGACSTDIDLYADYKQVPVIYGLLDANADTNFVKITRVFYVQGDAYQVAQNPDSSNYPGKLDVRLVEYCNDDSIREIVLDTVTIHDKQPGIFYGPSQKLYYTTEPLGRNTKNNQYSYCQFLFRPAVKGAIYQVTFSFTFLEQREPDGDSVPRTMSWEVGTFTDDDFSMHMDGDAYVILYRPEDFYANLREFVGDDTTLLDVQRFIGDYPAEVTIVAGDENLRQYVYNNNTENGFSQGDNEFSLIDGGYGVFSSRMTMSRRVRLAGETVPDLVAMRHWRFKFIGGE